MVSPFRVGASQARIIPKNCVFHHARRNRFQHGEHGDTESTEKKQERHSGEKTRPARIVRRALKTVFEPLSTRRHGEKAREAFRQKTTPGANRSPGVENRFRHENHKFAENTEKAQ
jgi:hypothetical protein